MFAPIRIALLGLGASCAIACATTAPPSELVAARSAYHEAEEGPASANAKAELADAQKALVRAEKSFRDDGASGDTRDLAYLAIRRSEIATAVARRRVAEDDKARYEKEHDQVADDLRETTVTELKTTRQELSREEQKRAEERDARIAAEQKQQVAEVGKAQAEAELAAAREALRQWAQLVENERGLVIIMSSGVLFASGRSEVLPEAGMRLQAIASFLRLSPGRRIVIEGHTDSAGSDAYNMTLSQARASSVMAFLVMQGMPPERMNAIGYGESRPVATNATIEGRANNRRVEIVLAPLPVPGT